jgi:preprotein translocase subunit SecG
MVGFVIFLHVIASLLLIFIVLLQTGKGAEMGAVFGSSSSSVFGPTGPANILTKITIGAVVVFVFTSLFLTYNFSKTPTKSIVPATKTAPQPAKPAVPQPAPSAPVEKK